MEVQNVRSKSAEEFDFINDREDHGKVKFDCKKFQSFVKKTKLESNYELL
jgi:hypothetical protein